METCPCCGASMLRHIRSRQLFWLCQSCAFELVIRSNAIEARRAQAQSSRFLDGLSSDVESVL